MQRDLSREPIALQREPAADAKDRRCQHRIQQPIDASEKHPAPVGPLVAESALHVIVERREQRRHKPYGKDQREARQLRPLPVRLCACQRCHSREDMAWADNASSYDRLLQSARHPLQFLAVQNHHW
jgi:hypothetical protein